MRGEHATDPRNGQRYGGSSPHARGTPLGDGLGSGVYPVHPRMRGEHVLTLEPS